VESGRGKLLTLGAMLTTESMDQLMSSEVESVGILELMAFLTSFCSIDVR
jgi:hypothetical protein